MDVWLFLTLASFHTRPYLVGVLELVPYYFSNNIRAGDKGKWMAFQPQCIKIAEHTHQG